MNKLYYAPGACSIGIHILLAEIGRPFAAEAVNLREPPGHRALTGLNPKSKVPTLVRPDGSVLTEFPAIAYWLARSNPEAGLLPEDLEGQARALETIDYCVATLHMQGFARINRPERFAPNPADHEAVKAQGMEIFTKGLAVLDHQLAGRDFVTGRFSVADAAVFYIELWASKRLQLALPPHCTAHFARLQARPAVAAVLKTEGFA
ncbi:Glutathione S-transferase [Rhodovastum atsumiense]|uniref:Glutathione S-transferase n=1 Tax=Rhodovastum atsumiense TaxID=504468 RepID=A0A5M6IT08_9PROT|nr:glutathione S-transferase C-terminal domain-containing protein [Rhodovastum atsumiense]KAA5611039.1 glutathione S-transferase [Rhodovastum atsumiense]CAH2600174.1 Glutathione S-transferase [Rhodovastum atsumiense]